MKFDRDVLSVIAIFCITVAPNTMGDPNSNSPEGSIEYGATNGSHSTSAHGVHQERVEIPSPSTPSQDAPPTPPGTTVQYSDSQTKLSVPHGSCKSYQDKHKKMRAACNWDPEPEPSEPAGDDGPRTITITTRQAATLIAQGSGITRQPPGPKVIISMAFIVYTNPTPRYQTTTILGTPIEVEFTPASYTWGWGDGTTTTTTDPGAPYPNQTVTHHYQHTATGVTTTLTTTWTTRYRPQGDPTWRPIEGTITTTETSTPYDLVRVVTYLTDDAEEAQGH